MTISGHKIEFLVNLTVGVSGGAIIESYSAPLRCVLNDYTVKTLIHRLQGLPINLMARDIMSRFGIGLYSAPDGNRGLKRGDYRFPHSTHVIKSNMYVHEWWKDLAPYSFQISR